jgi:hypothetical protein
MIASRAIRSLRIGQARAATIAGSVAKIRDAALAEMLSRPSVEHRYAAPGSRRPKALAIPRERVQGILTRRAKTIVQRKILLAAS